MISEVTGPSNKGMKLSKPDYLVGRWPIRLGIIESGFAAYAQCYAELSASCATDVLTPLHTFSG